MKSILSLTLFIFLLAGCGNLSDKDYLNKAEESIKQNNSNAAVEAYEALIEEYPESNLAPGALWDLARIYQNRQIKNLTEKESFIKAAKIYRELFDKYPDSNLAAKSLFMSGFLLANEPVEKYEEATETYKLFLENFPDHELAISAEAEIENMGIPPEIPEKKIVTGK